LNVAPVKKVNRDKISPKVIAGALIAVFFAVAFYFRAVLPHDQVFVGDWVKFTSNDAYYYMRLVDNWIFNFPTHTAFDPYFIYPGGNGVVGVHFFEGLLAVITWIIGLGSPTQHTIDVVGAYYPAVLGALTVIPVYFIGKTLFNRWVGVLAAGLIAVMSGEFLGRSILGFTDHHVAETLFSATAALFVILAIKESGQRQLTFSHFIKRDWRVFIKPLIYSLLAGIFLGFYLITWLGAQLFVFIISLYFLIQFTIDYLRRKPTDHLGIIWFILLLVAYLIFLPFSPAGYFSVPLFISVVVPLILIGLSVLISTIKLKPVYFPLALVGVGIISLAIFHAVKPDIFSVVMSNFNIFTPSGATATTTLEMQPFLSPQGTFSTLIAWGNFSTNFFLVKAWPIPGFGFIAFVILIWLSIKQRNDEKQQLPLRVLTLVILVAALIILYFSLIWALVLIVVFFALLIWLSINQRSNEKHWLFFLIWTLTILIATLAQRRFAYYLVVNIAVLSGYISWQSGWLVGLKKLVTKTELSTLINYKQARNIGVPSGIILLILCVFFGKILYIFLPVWLIGVASLLFGCWGWAKYKGRSDLWALWGLLAPIGFIVLALMQKETKKAKQKNVPKENQNTYIYYVNTIIAILVVFSFVSLFNISGAKTVASQATFAPSDAWEASMHWLKQNTPEPMGNPEAYYQLDAVPGEGGYKYPPTAYGVTAWWDYGYWISRTAHRIPSANPSQASGPIIKVAKLFLANDEASTYAMMKELSSSYIIIDFSTCTTKFWAVNTWAGRNPSEFVGTYYVAKEGKLVPVQLFLPEYYRTLCVRLYNFNGKAVEAKNPAVITFEKKVDDNGNSFEQITDIKQFASYQEALDNVAKAGVANHRIIGLNPFISPVPLEAVQDYKLIYSSESGISNQDVGLVPEVKIFEYPGK